MHSLNVVLPIRFVEYRGGRQRTDEIIRILMTLNLRKALIPTDNAELNILAGWSRNTRCTE